MKEIPLTKGFVALVDDADYERLNQWKWYASLSCRGKFYARRNIILENGKRGGIYMHKQIVGNDCEEVDHKDGNSMNNQRANLRPCLMCKNRQNMSLSRRNTSGFKGVTKFREKWRARIVVDKEEKRLGVFNSAIEAAIAYNDAALKYHGEFSNLNLIPT